MIPHERIRAGARRLQGKRGGEIQKKLQPQEQMNSRILNVCLFLASLLIISCNNRDNNKKSIVAILTNNDKGYWDVVRDGEPFPYMGECFSVDGKLYSYSYYRYLKGKRMKEMEHDDLPQLDEWSMVSDSIIKISYFNYKIIKIDKSVIILDNLDDNLDSDYWILIKSKDQKSKIRPLSSFKHGRIKIIKNTENLAAKAASEAWKPLIHSKLTGKGADKIGNYIRIFNNQGSYLSENNLDSAIKAISGLAIRNAYYQRLGEVEAALSGMNIQIYNLKDDITSGTFDANALKSAQAMLSDVTKQYNEIKNTLDKAKKVTKQLYQEW